MIGQTISHYKIFEKLGEGGMGVVYKAKDTKLKRTVALKFLPPELMWDSGAKERFLHEAQAAAALEHQHICNIYEIDETGDQIFIVMSCFEGQTLKEKIDSGPLKIDEALKIAVQAAEGLQAAHEKEIVHRDIKSENIMINEKGQVKIMDFGLAKLKGQTKLTKEGTILGTTAYMSPEQAQGADVDLRTDIWSLGVVLYEMITGQLPFKGEYEPAVLYSIMNEEPEPLTALRTGLPMELERIVNKSLAKNPSERYQHADDLVVDLKKLEKDTKPEITPSPGITPIHPVKKPYLKFLIPGIFLLIALAALAYFLFFKGPSKSASSKTSLNPKRVVVAVFENLTGDESLDVLGRMAADWVTQGISRMESIEAVPNMVVMQLLKAKRSGKEVPQRMVFLQSLAEDVDARTMITGSYYLSGENLCFQANITDMEQEKLLFSLEPIIGPKKSPITTIDKLKQKVMGALISYFDPGNSVPVLGYKIPTFDAYKEVMAGNELFGTDWSRAITHYKRAIELDPDFYIPKFYLAIAYFNLDDYASVDTINRQLYEKRDQLSDFERYWLECGRATLEGNIEKRLLMMRKMGDIARKVPDVWYEIGRHLLLLNRPRETIKVYKQFGERHWSFSTFNSWRINVQTAAYHMLGEFQEELELAKKGQEIFPENLKFLSAEARALAALGKTDEVKKVIDKSLTISSSLETPGDVMLEATLELRAHGHMNAYRETVTRTIDWYKNRPPGEAAAENHRIGLAKTLYMAEQWDQSESIFKDLSGKKPDNIYYKGYLGLLAVRKGNLKEARKISNELKKLSRPYLFGGHTFFCARIASLLNEKQRAVELLRESFAQGRVYGVFLHQVIDFEPIKEYPPFKELMRPRG